MQRFSVRIVLAFTLCMIASVGSLIMAAPAPQQGGRYTVYLPVMRKGAAVQPPTKPSVAGFSANPATIAPGGSTTLRWNVSGATSLRITPTIGAVTGTSVSARPAATTTYTLIASNSAGETRATATVTVKAPESVPSGFFTHRDYLMYNAATAVDANGGIHLAFNVSDEKHEENPTGEPALYTYCPGPATACTDPSKWSTLVSLTERVTQVQIAVTPDGRPRLLVGRARTDQNWTEYIYFACEQGCTNVDNWNGLIIAQPAGIEVFEYDNPQHSFALDSQGRPRFVYANTWGNGEPNAIHYAYCDAADCTEPGSWSTGDIMKGPEYKTLGLDYASLAFVDDKPRIVSRITLSGMATDTVYFECDELECDQDFEWNHVFLPYPGEMLWTNWDLAVSKNGQLRVALYEPATPDIVVGGKLYYGQCDDRCSAIDSWQFTQVTSGEGKNVDLAIDAAGRTHMVYDAGQRGTLGEVWCDSNCTNAAQWQRRILETSEQLQREFAPASPLTCDQDQRVWLDAIPSVAFDAQGRLVVAYDVRNVTFCYYTDPNNPGGPPYQKVQRLWWAVRWAQFPRP
ncbi:MAG TPA: hypothetical protein VFO07_10200 [Roseiflexaceae bacterium]|nr:hypothetical protein [Roseiflexaceae bacterium]